MIGNCGNFERSPEKAGVGVSIPSLATPLPHTKHDRYRVGADFLCSSKLPFWSPNGVQKDRLQDTAAVDPVGRTRSSEDHPTKIQSSVIGMQNMQNRFLLDI